MILKVSSCCAALTASHLHLRSSEARGEGRGGGSARRGISTLSISPSVHHPSGHSLPRSLDRSVDRSLAGEASCPRSLFSVAWGSTEPRSRIIGNTSCSKGARDSVQSAEPRTSTRLGQGVYGTDEFRRSSLRELRKDADVEKHIRHRLKQETHAKQRERRSSASNNTARTQQAILNSTVVLDRKLAEEQTVEGDAMEPITQHLRHVNLGQEGAAAAAQPLANGQSENVAAVDSSIRTDAMDGPDRQKDNKEGQTVSYNAERIIGNGSFGVVFQALVVETGEVVAIKKVLQDKRFKNRELQIMRMLVKDGHPNIVHLKHCFYSNGDKADELYLNLVLEYVPETVYSVARQYQKSKQPLPVLFVQLYMWQLARALAHIHALNICHRDIKPQNLLLDPATHVLKLCDFGSAKILVKGEPNVSYICSRYYRAPELIFGSTDYTCSIDTWSLGCVGAELLLGQPLFPGDSGVDQLVEIIKVLGTPSRDEIRAMNSNYTEFKFPQIKAHPWNEVFHSKTSPDAVDVISSMLAYDPAKRIPLLDVCLHPFFDSLRDTSVTLPDGGPLPELFTFTDLEIRSCPRLSTVAQEMGKRGGSLPAPAVAGAADAVGTGSSHRSSGESGAGNATAT